MSTIMREIISASNVIEKHIDLTVEDEKYLLDTVSSINTKVLYNSKIHGLYHSEKVFLFCYLIAKDENLNEVERQIITDAALYHDIGRINDYEDSIHGYCSANRIEDVVNNPIYEDKENLKILKAIVDGHSVSDKRRDRFIEDYEIIEVDRYYKLYDILKDADALDRKRFFDYSNAHLDKRYLRTNISKDLVKLSEEINNIYKSEIIGVKNKLPEPEVGTYECFHSVGFDFFKIGSVLKNGILSKGEMKKLGINKTTNFEGGNLNDYVSVVDARLIDKGGTAYSTFITNGVSFVCDVDKLYSSDEKYSKSYCIEKGIPYNKSLHKDEKYVYSKIEPQNIKHIFLSDEIINKDVRELIYIYNSLSYEILSNRINHYITNVSDVFSPNTNEINKLLDEYKKALEDYFILDVIEKSKIKKQFIKKLESYRIKINSIIQEWIYLKYIYELDRNYGDVITVDDVVSLELQKLDLNYEKTKTDKGYLISYQKLKTKIR